METPPALPSNKPPLGGPFYFALLLPIVFMAICGALVDKGDLILPALGITGLVTLVCSAFLAMRLARRVSKTGEASIGMTILMFIAVQGFYGICFFIGCTALVARG